MAYIRFIADTELAPGDRVVDPDNIIQVHAIHPAVMRPAKAEPSANTLN